MMEIIQILNFSSLTVLGVVTLSLILISVIAITLVVPELYNLTRHQVLQLLSLWAVLLITIGVMNHISANIKGIDEIDTNSLHFTTTTVALTEDNNKYFYNYTIDGIQYKGKVPLSHVIGMLDTTSNNPVSVSTYQKYNSTLFTVEYPIFIVE